MTIWQLAITPLWTPDPLSFLLSTVSHAGPAEVQAKGNLIRSSGPMPHPMQVAHTTSASWLADWYVPALLAAQDKSLIAVSHPKTPLRTLRTRTFLSSTLTAHLEPSTSAPCLVTSWGPLAHWVAILPSALSRSALSHHSCLLKFVAASWRFHAGGKGSDIARFQLPTAQHRTVRPYFTAWSHWKTWVASSASSKRLSGCHSRKSCRRSRGLSWQGSL